MPVRDRKFYIAKHNGIIEEETKKQNKKDGNIDGLFIDKFTDLTQQNLENAKKGRVFILPFLFIVCLKYQLHYLEK